MKGCKNCPAVHPHVRGVYGRTLVLQRHSERSIPTCVGFTRSSCTRRYDTTVHPHVRGVYKSWTAALSMYSGPSPRAWGLLVYDVSRVQLARSIPTCVGFTCSSAARAISFFGPSPRAWGLRTRRKGPDNGCRSIPTCVGFTFQWNSNSQLLPVHPHVRGVYSWAACSASSLAGPSPRAWGLPGPYDPKASDQRSIPTCVGFTQLSRISRWLAPVHPHVRGVYTIWICT